MARKRKALQSDNWSPRLPSGLSTNQASCLSMPLAPSAHCLANWRFPGSCAGGVAVIGRTNGIVGHLAEELRNPIAREVWERTEEESSEHNRT